MGSSALPSFSKSPCPCHALSLSSPIQTLPPIPLEPPSCHPFSYTATLNCSPTCSHPTQDARSLTRPTHWTQQTRWTLSHPSQSPRQMHPYRQACDTGSCGGTEHRHTHCHPAFSPHLETLLPLDAQNALVRTILVLPTPHNSAPPSTLGHSQVHVNLPLSRGPQGRHGLGAGGWGLGELKASAAFPGKS